MSCCEKQKIERLKKFELACVLTCQQANLLNKTLAVVRMTHHLYGDYYGTVDYEDRGDRKVLRKFSPGDTMAVQKGD